MPAREGGDVERRGALEGYDLTGLKVFKGVEMIMGKCRSIYTSTEKSRNHLLCARYLQSILDSDLTASQVATLMWSSRSQDLQFWMLEFRVFQGFFRNSSFQAVRQITQDRNVATFEEACERSMRLWAIF